jgi:hypothetical protein
MTQAAHKAGILGTDIKPVIPGPRFLSVDGIHDGTPLLPASWRPIPPARGNEIRWFLDTPLLDHDRTWVLSKMWGLETEPTLTTLTTPPSPPPPAPAPAPAPATSPSKPCDDQSRYRAGRPN